MNSYIVYYIFIFLAAVFAELSQIFAKDKKKYYKINKLFYALSFIMLFILIGLRKCGVGVDDNVYRDIFININNKGIMNTFSILFLEPGYLLLNRIVGLFTKNFQVLLAVVTFIPLFCYYKTFHYYRKEINFFVAFIVFGFVFIIYYFGIIRLFISTGLCAYASIYFYEKKQKKFNILILFASSFHYSALIFLMLNLLINKEYTKNNLIKFYSIIVVLIPLLFIIVSRYVLPHLSFKYAGYTLSGNFKISLADFDKLPFIFIFFIFYGYMKKINLNVKTHIVIFSVSIILSIYSSIVDFGRLEWYFAFEQCILLPMLIKTLFKNGEYVLNIFLIPLIIIYCFLYSNKMFNSEIRGNLYSNYQNILIDNIRR